MKSSANWGAERRQKLKQNLPPASPFPVIGERMMAVRQGPKVPARSWFYLH